MRSSIQNPFRSDFVPPAPATTRACAIVAPTPSIALVAGTLILVGGAGIGRADELAVPNGSFELPATGFVDTRVDVWQKSPQPIWFDPTTAGITWDQLSGVFANTPADQPSHINNLAGNQAVYMIALPQVALSQELHGAGAQFTAGFAYELTVGMLGGGGLPEGTSFQLGLYYLDAANTPVTVAGTVVTYSTLDFPTSSQLVDRSVQVPVVQPTDAWVGKDIGVALVSVGGNGTGYWDLDNVRITTTAVPEPGPLALLGVGLGGVLLSRGWPRRRA